MATHAGGGCVGGSQIRDRTERGGRSCARERFKRPRVSKQIVSLIRLVNAPRSTVTHVTPSATRMQRDKSAAAMIPSASITKTEIN